MDPFGHHHHHHRRDAGDEEEEHHHPPSDNHPPPPPFYGGAGDEFGRPPFPPLHHVSHEVGSGYAPPPPAGFPPVHHVSHEAGYGYDRPPEPYPPAAGYYGGAAGDERQHGYRPHHEAPPPPYSSGVQHLGHDVAPVAEPERTQPRQQTYRIFTRAEENFSLSIRNGEVALVRNDPSDEFQHWIKDLTYSTKVKDSEGFPAFSLINKVTGEAIKHSIGKNHPVRLVKYIQDYLDESVLWTESKDVGDGYRCIRMVNNIHLNFDAFHGDKDHGGVKDGTTVVLWEWWKGDNQKWKIVPR